MSTVINNNFFFAINLQLISPRGLFSKLFFSIKLSIFHIGVHNDIALHITTTSKLESSKLNLANDLPFYLVKQSFVLLCKKEAR